MALARNAIVVALLGWARRLRFRTLFVVTAVLLAIDLAVPDPIPFADEVLLGLAALMLASLRRRGEDDPALDDDDEDDPATPQASP